MFYIKLSFKKSSMYMFSFGPRSKTNMLVTQGVLMLSTDQFAVFFLKKKTTGIFPSDGNLSISDHNVRLQKMTFKLLNGKKENNEIK